MTGLEGIDEADIEEEITRELQALNDLDVKDIEDESADLPSSNKSFANAEEIYGLPPDSVETFIRLLQSRNAKIQGDLAEAQDTLESRHNVVIATKDKEITDENSEEIPEDVKDKVLTEIEELEVQGDKSSDNIEYGDDNIASLEEMGMNNLKELEKKQHLMKDRLEIVFNEIKEEEMARKKREEEIREQNKKKADEEYRMRVEKNQAMKLKLEEEARCKERKLKDLEKQLEVEMKDMEKRQKEERHALQKLKEEERRKQREREEKACITIQKNYRRFRVMFEYGKTLGRKREERRKRRLAELEALERRERELMEEAVKKAQEEEERRLKEIELEKERKRQEEEKKRQEEELRKKLEIERKKKEEEERRLAEERRKREEEKNRREEENRRRKEEEKRKREEDERRREVEERRRREEEERRRRDEEERRRREEERTKQIEEERKKREEEERKKLEEGEKRIGEEKKREEEQRKIDEARKAGEEGRELVKKARKGWEEHKKMDENERTEECTKNNKEGGVEGRLADRSRLTRTDTNAIECKINNANYKAKRENNYEKEYQHETESLRESTVSVKTISELNGDLCSELECRRNEWLRRTTPWNLFSAKDNTTVKARSKPRRPLSASQKLPSISEEELADSFHNFTSLEKVVWVNVQDLPPRNLKIMLKCPSLKSVTVRNCGLLAADNFDNCKSLKELNLSNNSIHNVSCQNIESLEHLDLRNNQLTSIHGLDGCHELKTLLLDGNKITRIGSFQSNQIVQLSLQNNQLINTKGLSQMKHLQILDCSNNYLNNVEQLASCLLLRILRLKGNNLQKPPVLNNHVLLREVHLSENSISSLECLSVQWLPLLKHLYVDNNSLSSVCPLRGLPMLETVDVRNNLISDEENLLLGLIGCHRLRNLRIRGNPVCEDSMVKISILKTLPKLETLDEENLDKTLSNSGDRKKTIWWESIYQNQILAQDEMLEKHVAEKREFQDELVNDGQVIERLSFQSRHFEELQELMINHRLEHENLQNVEPKNEMDDVVCESPKRISVVTPVSESPKVDTSRTKENVTLERQEKTIHTDVVPSSLPVLSDLPERTLREETKTVASSSAAFQPGGDKLVTIWTGNHHRAATLIQVHFRGFRIRKRYLEATKSAHYPGMDLGEEEFNFDEEVDLSMFDMDEAALESSWAPASSPQSLPREPSRPLSPPDQKKCDIEDDNYRPFLPRQAWRSPDSPVTQYNPKRVIPPIEAPSVSEQTAHSEDTTHRSHRTSELSSEWGFNKNVTAELMLKRAKRMKYNALRKKKLNDPEKRFELFKKTEEANKAREVRPMPKKKEWQRVDYFTGRTVIQQPPAVKPAPSRNEEEKAKEEMTFSWIYDQAVLHKDKSDDILRDTKGYFTESRPAKNRSDKSPPVSLPRMDPVILAGRNLPLVASPVGNPRPSASNASDLDLRLHRKHSWSTEKTHSNPDLTRAGLNKVKETREKSNSADARITRERNNLM